MKSGEVIGDHATEHVDAAEAMRFEDTVWWFAGRRAILRSYLDRARREAPLDRIAEIGCGSGSHLALLAEYGEVTGFERSATLAARARSREVARQIHVGDFNELDLPHEYQITCLFDVLEHVRDDGALLRQLSRRAPGGHLLLLSVPACPCLYGPHDVLLHHYRRYSGRGLRRLLQDNGYTVLMGSHHLFFVFPIAVLSRLKEKFAARVGRRQTAVELGAVPGPINAALIRVLQMEAIIARLVPLPIGLWYIALAKKR